MKYALLLLFTCAAFFAHAQKGTTTFSISYGEGKGQIKPLMAKAEMSGSYAEGSVRAYGLGISGMASKHTALEIGFSVLNHRYQYTKYDFPSLQQPVNRSVNTLVFPIKLKIDILKFFFISGGFLLNASVGGQDEFDVGIGIGAGIQYYFKNKYGIFIYPQTNLHTITIGLKESHTAFGLAYRIPYPNPPYKN